jgi:hypothetical protein
MLDKRPLEQRPPVSRTPVRPAQNQHKPAQNASYRLVKVSVIVDPVISEGVEQIGNVDPIPTKVAVVLASTVTEEHQLGLQPQRHNGFEVGEEGRPLC